MEETFIFTNRHAGLRQWHLSLCRAGKVELLTRQDHWDRLSKIPPLIKKFWSCLLSFGWKRQWYHGFMTSANGVHWAQKQSTSCSCCQIQRWLNQAPRHCQLPGRSVIFSGQDCQPTQKMSTVNRRLPSRSGHPLEARSAQQSFDHFPFASGSVL